MVTDMKWEIWLPWSAAYSLGCIQRIFSSPNPAAKTICLLLPPLGVRQAARQAVPESQYEMSLAEPSGTSCRASKRPHDETLQ